MISRNNVFIAYILACAVPLVTTAGSYVVDTDVRHQTIDGFGASDAWSMRFVGEMPQQIQKRTADLLFSQETDANGQPEGIGLNIWRFNIGAGSLEQGDKSRINYGTRTDCFLLPDGTYDWGKQHGQVEFMKLAKERGVTSFLGFLNSPPVHFTQNGLANNDGRGASYNLKEECYAPLAKFIADVVQGLDSVHGIHLDYISPINEPDGHWNWTGPKQEGSPATKYEIARVARTLDAELTRRGMDTRLIIPESSDYRCMMSTHMTGPDRGYEIQSFFSPDSADTYVADIARLHRLAAGHSYWTNTPVEYMKECRQQLADTLKKYGADFWQTEVCIMGNDDEIGGGAGYDRTMKTALYVARTLHHDMVYAGAKSWQWWRAVGGDYKDGLLHQYTTDAGTDTIVDSKLLWAMGHYSRFIRRGAVRVEIGVIDASGRIAPDSATDPWGEMLSAYLNPDGSVVVVALNYSETPQTVTLSHPGKKPSDMPHMKVYRTSDNGESLAPSAAEGGTVVLAPKSVATIIW